MANKVSLLVGQSGDAFTLTLAPGTEEPAGWLTDGGDTFTFTGSVNTYEFTFSAVSPLTFGSPPVVSIPNLEGVHFSVLDPEFTGFKLQVTVTSSLGEPYTIPFTISTSEGPFDPSIVIDPPP